MEEIKEKLAAIESLLQHLPEIQAAIFIRMWDEYQKAKMELRDPADLWEIAPPNQR